MHRLRSKSAIFRFRLAALLFCVKSVLFPASAGMLAYSLIGNDHEYIKVTLVAVAISAVSVIVQWVVGQRTNCPLCITPVLASRTCSKSRHARKFLGSHRLRVALAILFRNSFRCPYCNEPTALEVRNRLHYPPYSRG